MSSSFPGAIDNFTDPLSNSNLSSPSHAGQHQDLNDAVEKIETYMGLVKVIPTAATNGTITSDGDVTVGNAVSSVSVTCFSSLYDSYRIIYTTGVGSGIAVINMTLGSTATGYYQGGISVPFTGATLLSQVNNGPAWANTGVMGTDYANVVVEIHNPYLSKKTFITWDYLYTAEYIRIGGYLNNTTSYTSFTLTPGAGTLTGGNIRVYGYRN